MSNGKKICLLCLIREKFTNPDELQMASAVAVLMGSGEGNWIEWTNACRKHALLSIVITGKLETMMAEAVGKKPDPAVARIAAAGEIFVQDLFERHPESDEQPR